jgi:hypothetical protein
MRIAILVVILFLIGCSKTSNPVHFSKAVSKVTTSASGETTSENKLKIPNYTLLEMYLHGIVTKEYVMAWFFEDARHFREKLLIIKDEIKSKMPVSNHDRNLILVLEYAMNTLIRKFNDRNVLSRSKEIFSAAIESSKEYEDRVQEYTENFYDLGTVKNGGAPAKVISDQPIGFLGSFFKYGFKIEEIDFFDFRD